MTETTENTVTDNTENDNNAADNSANDNVENTENSAAGNIEQENNEQESAAQEVTSEVANEEPVVETKAEETKAVETKSAGIKKEVKPVQSTPAQSTANASGLNIPGKKWYAIRTITGHEKRVKNYLDGEILEIGLEHKIAQVLIPEEKVFEVKGGKKKVKYKNFFPGYVLVEAVLDKEIINFLSHAPSVLKMVGDKNDAVALRDDEVNRILGRINESDEVQKIDMQFEKGDLIKVINGPFATFTGTINEINLERMKVKVMVSIFGRKTPIELDFSQIEKEK